MALITKLCLEGLVESRAFAVDVRRRSPAFSIAGVSLIRYAQAGLSTIGTSPISSIHGATFGRTHDSFHMQLHVSNLRNDQNGSLLPKPLVPPCLSSAMRSWGLSRQHGGTFIVAFS